MLTCRKAAARRYPVYLSILVDDEAHYSNTNLLEQYHQRPAILQSFGWKIMPVFAKDWLKQPQKVMDQIIKRLKEIPAPGTASEIQHEATAAVPVAVTADSSKEAVLLIEDSVVPAATPYDHLVFQQLVNTENGSNKFWEIAIDKAKLVVRFGKTGTRGQVQVKTFADEAMAEKERDKLLREKLGKGYK